MRVVLTLLEESAVGAAQWTRDAESRAAWQELRNKLEAFRTFEHVDSLLALPISSPLRQLTNRAAALSPPLCVWAAEGVAYHVTAARCANGHAPRGLLADGMLPHQLLVPMHAGMGSALAAAILDRFVERRTRALPEAVEELEAVCRANSHPAHLGVALEALGFAAQSMFGELVRPLAAVMDRSRSYLAPYFWHGAGRAMYFAPTTSLPIAGERAQTIEQRLAAAEGDRINTIAGYSWAATLVNLRHPYVLEPLVHAAAVAPDRRVACGLGVQSALEVWRRCAPADPALARFDAHVPSTPRARDAWRRVVGEAPRPRARDAGDLFAIACDNRHAGAQR